MKSRSAILLSTVMLVAGFVAHAVYVSVFAPQPVVPVLGPEEEPLIVTVGNFGGHVGPHVYKDVVTLEYDSTSIGPSEILWELRQSSGTTGLANVAIEIRSVVPQQIAKSIFENALPVLTPSKPYSSSGKLSPGLIFDADGMIHVKYDVVAKFTNGTVVRLDPKIIIRK